MDQDTASSSGTSRAVQNRAIERYIRAIIHMQMKDIGRRTLEDRIADAITAFSGSMLFVYIHIAWFAGWILANLGLFGIQPFDPFPYGLLTMIVSLEAIFLSTFVLVSQNREARGNEQRNTLDLHVDLLTEYELTRVIQMLHTIQQKLDIPSEDIEDLAELEEEIDPEAILDKIEKLQERIGKFRAASPKNQEPDDRETEELE